MIKTKQELLNYFSDINFMYNNPFKYQTLSNMIDELLEQQPQQRWILCSERLPEDYIHVLCQFTLGGMGECYLAHGLFHIVGGVRVSHDEIIAWMPLPKPYKAESEDEE